VQYHYEGNSYRLHLKELALYCMACLLYEAFVGQGVAWTKGNRG
jgi:hypothetical protein